MPVATTAAGHVCVGVPGVLVVGGDGCIVAARPHSVVHGQQGFDKGACQEFEELSFIVCTAWSCGLELVGEGETGGRRGEGGRGKKDTQTLQTKGYF